MLGDDVGHCICRSVLVKGERERRKNMRREVERANVKYRQRVQNLRERSG